MSGLVALIVLVVIIYSGWSHMSDSMKNSEDKDRNQQRYDIFQANRIKGIFSIDDNNSLFSISEKSNLYFKFDELESFKLYQDNNTLTSGSTGSVNVGLGLNLGGVDASSTTEVQRLDIVYKVNGLNEDRYTQPILKKPTIQSSDEFRLAIEKAEDSIEFLEEILGK